MKNLFLFSIISIFISCKKTDQVSKNDLKGTWTVTSISCMFCSTIDMSTIDVSYHFKPFKNKLVVENKDNLLKFSLHSSGNYKLDFVEGFLIIEGITYDYYIENEILYIAYQPANDGFVLGLSK